MKEVPKKHLPDVAGGYTEGGCIPYPGQTGDPDYPRNPGAPWLDEPLPDITDPT
jgi:hypothetical protein